MKCFASRDSTTTFNSTKIEKSDKRNCNLQKHRDVLCTYIYLAKTKEGKVYEVIFHISTNERNKGNKFSCFPHTENATLKQALNGACPMTQRLALNVLELTETPKSNPLKIRGNLFIQILTLIEF